MVVTQILVARDISNYPPRTACRNTLIGRVKSNFYSHLKRRSLCILCAGESELEMDQDSAGASPVNCVNHSLQMKWKNLLISMILGRHPVVSQARRVRGLTGHPRGPAVGRPMPLMPRESTSHHHSSFLSRCPTRIHGSVRNSLQVFFRYYGQPPVGDSARKAVAMRGTKEGVSQMNRMPGIRSS